MAAAIAQLRGGLTVPFGVDILWDPIAAIGLAHAVGASFVREVFTGTYAGDFGTWNTDPAGALALPAGDRGAGRAAVLQRHRGVRGPGGAARDRPDGALGGLQLVGRRDLRLRRRSPAQGPTSSDLAAAKAAVGAEVAVIANTGVRPATVGEILGTVDACIVGTSLKRDGVTWNEVDRARVDALLDAAERSGSWQPGVGAPSGAASAGSGGRMA